MSRLYLDCDGVLADFERGAAEVLGAPPAEFRAARGETAMWRRLEAAPGFYARLPLMPDAMTLWGAVRHLGPIILTGVPRGGWAEAQKLAWRDRWFPGAAMVTCRSAEKAARCRPGDVLVDDWTRYADRWRAAGGVFVHHRDALSTLAALADLFAGEEPA